MIKTASTMRDVAQQAGVSVTTVSRVLQDNDIPTEQTRQRVLEVVGRLGYKPRRRRKRNPTAKTDQKAAVAFLTATDVAADVGGDFDQYEKLVNSLRKWLDVAGYRLYYERWASRLEPLPAVLNDPQTFGAVVMGALPAAVGTSLGQRLPLVCLDNGRNMNLPADLALCSITDLMSSSLRYLMDLGHRRVVLFSDQRDAAHDYYLDTFLAESTRLGIGLDPMLRKLCLPRLIDDQNYIEAFEAYLHQLRSLGPARPTAVLLNYRHAMGLVGRAQRVGWSIPEDLSIVGITDRLLHYMHPPITAYGWPMEELGRSAVDLLVSRIQEPTRPYRHLAVRGQIIERASCGPCPNVAEPTK